MVKGALVRFFYMLVELENSQAVYTRPDARSFYTLKHLSRVRYTKAVPSTLRVSDLTQHAIDKRRYGNFTRSTMLVFVTGDTMTTWCVADGAERPTSVAKKQKFTHNPALYPKSPFPCGPTGGGELQAGYRFMVVYSSLSWFVRDPSDASYRFSSISSYPSGYAVLPVELHPTQIETLQQQLMRIAKKSISACAWVAGDLSYNEETGAPLSRLNRLV